MRPLSFAALAVALTASASAFPNTNPPYAGYVTTDEYGKLNAQHIEPSPSTRTIAVFAEGQQSRRHGKAVSQRMRHDMGNAHDQRY